MNDLWQHGKYMRLPLQEMPEETRYKMQEKAKPIYLFPDANGVIPEEPKGSGCPLGYGKDD